MSVKTQLIYYRNLHNLSKTDLSKKMYVSRQTISNWETGKTYPDIQNLILLSDIYQITIDQLVKDDINVMQNASSKHKLKLLITGLISTLVLVYASFIGMKWIPITTAAMLVSIFSTLGVIDAILLIRLKNDLQIRTMKQALDFMHGKSVKQIKEDTKKRNIKLLLSSILGILLGTTLTYIIAVYLLNWSL
ncbi:helix-turn-helix transcriptional regulator [Companilactobacillus hulinensis]|uniref:helix-turn-helix transcriptional regulator n=1 Tax=Companilactobacillus hulinensis TaxID=2486007 RepID=UPI000F7A612F|nr:helix-turn-helix domain-containing protein [Companilactobacillus hulinensis]